MDNEIKILNELSSHKQEQHRLNRENNQNFAQQQHTNDLLNNKF